MEILLIFPFLTELLFSFLLDAGPPLPQSSEIIQTHQPNLFTLPPHSLNFFWILLLFFQRAFPFCLFIYFFPLFLFICSADISILSTIATIYRVISAGREQSGVVNFHLASPSWPFLWCSLVSQLVDSDGRLLSHRGAEWGLFTYSSWVQEHGHRQGRTSRNRARPQHAMSECAVVELPDLREGVWGLSQVQEPSHCGWQSRVSHGQPGPEPMASCSEFIFSCCCPGQQGHWEVPGRGTIRCLSGPGIGQIDGFPFGGYNYKVSQ